MIMNSNRIGLLVTIIVATVGIVLTWTGHTIFGLIILTVCSFSLASIIVEIKEGRW